MVPWVTQRLRGGARIPSQTSSASLQDKEDKHEKSHHDSDGAGVEIQLVGTPPQGRAVDAVCVVGAGKLQAPSSPCCSNPPSPHGGDPTCQGCNPSSR